jgi:hypothetical protein
VPPCVPYGTACLIIRDAIGSESCCGVGKDTGRDLIHKVQEGI